MRVYLDICCLKRPFDDQSQARIALETAAILAISREWANARVSLLRSAAHDIENAGNTNAERAAAVHRVLEQIGPPAPTPDAVRQRADALHAAGLSTYDALHVAWAEHLGADVFVTVDDALARRAARECPTLRVLGPEECMKEISR